jgi:hypothetical protein
MTSRRLLRPLGTLLAAVLVICPRAALAQQCYGISPDSAS